jgi:hypothetical protein
MEMYCYKDAMLRDCSCGSNRLAIDEQCTNSVVRPDLNSVMLHHTPTGSEVDGACGIRNTVSQIT